MRRPPIVLGLATLTMLSLLAALALILFSVNPGVDRNEGEIEHAVTSQHAIICAQVQNTANSYRFRSLTPSGQVEPIRHFLTRMQAQQQTLRLARGSECKSAPGFPPVGLQVRQALDQINRILMHFEPRQRKPVDQRQTSSYRHPSFSPAFPKPPNAGVGEEGVPAVLHDELVPSAPLAPQKGHSRKPSQQSPSLPLPPPSKPEETLPSPQIPPTSPNEPKALPVPLPEIEAEIPGFVKGKARVVEPSISISVATSPEGG